MTVEKTTKAQTKLDVKTWKIPTNLRSLHSGNTESSPAITHKLYEHQEGGGKYIPQMRSLAEAMKTILEIDPQTSLTPTALRRLVRSEAIPSIKIGQKYLIDINAIWEYLASPVSKPQNTSDTTGIRKINEKIYKLGD